MKHISVIMPANSITCPFCKGDGIGRCGNPEHGFIEAMPGDIGRLGCPVCGHDDDYRVRSRYTSNGWETCEHCNGSGLVHNFTEEVLERLAEL